MARAEKGWQQQQLAQEAHISQKYLSRVENDKADPSWTVIKRLLAVIDLDLKAIAREVPS
jgi:transcriptional regulator with XRE-family HTH domain